MRNDLVFIAALACFACSESGSNDLAAGGSAGTATGGASATGSGGAATTGGGSGGAGGNGIAGSTGGAAGAGNPPPTDGGLAPCLDMPPDLPRVPTNGLPCELLPPNFKQ